MNISYRSTYLGLVAIALVGLVSNVSAQNIRARSHSISRSRSGDVAAPVPQPITATFTGTDPTPESHDIVETMIRAGGFETLTKLLFTARLAEDLKSPGPFTRKYRSVHAAGQVKISTPSPSAGLAFLLTRSLCSPQ
jgi:hypothetical protein